MDDDICTACLCSGRKLYFITETQSDTLYTRILNEIPIYDFSQVHIQLCWECKALLRRFHSFKQQVKQSYTQLLQCVHDDKYKYTVQVPSHLKTCQVHHDSFPHLIKTEDMDIKHEVEDTHCEPESFVNDLEFKTPASDDKTQFEYGADTSVCADESGMYGESGICDDNGDLDDVVKLPEVKTEVKKPIKDKMKKIVKSKKQKPKTEKKFGVKKKTVKFSSKDKDATVDVELNGIKNKFNKTEVIVEDGGGEAIGTTVLNGDVPLSKPARAAPSREALPERPQCAECGKQFSSRKTYRYHIEVLHKGKNRHPCPRCGKVYQWKSNLGRHMRSHTARDTGELYCEKCDKRFASVATYRQHLRVSRRHVSESDFSFMCNDCGKKFVSKTRLRDHIDWDHLHTVKFRCQLCNKPFKTYTSLYVHLQNVHRNKEKKDNLCHVCGKSYQNPAKLRYHIVAMHTSETPYQCEQCEASFGWYSSLYRHVKEVHYKIKLQPNRSKKLKKGDLPIPGLPQLEGGGPPARGPPNWAPVRGELLHSKKGDTLPVLLAQPFVVPVESQMGT